MLQPFNSARAKPIPRMLDSELQDTDNTITYQTPPVILRVLEEACSTRATLTVRYETTTRAHRFHTRIHSVDMLRMQVMLHQLTPADWLQLIAEDGEVDVRCHMPSGVLSFRTSPAPFEGDTTHPYCVLSLPLVVHKQQKRSSYRVVLPPGSSSVAFTWHERRLQGFCFNLSLEGCCGIFRGNLEDVVHDEVLADLSIALDDSLQFTTAATVCRRQLLPNGATLLGLRFDTLESDLQRRLQASLTSIQRRQLRTRS